MKQYSGPRSRFGRAIRRIREEQKINQETAAERCRLHRTYYSGIERGIRKRVIGEYPEMARLGGPTSPKVTSLLRGGPTSNRVHLMDIRDMISLGFSACHWQQIEAG